MSFLNFLQESALDDGMKLIEEKAEYQGKMVSLRKPFRDSSTKKKFAVYVKNKKGNGAKKVSFGDSSMEIKRDDPESRKNFRARHNCADAKDETTPRYWSCKFWQSGKSVSDMLSEYSEVRSDESTTAIISYDTRGRMIISGDNLRRHLKENSDLQLKESYESCVDEYKSGEYNSSKELFLPDFIAETLLELKDRGYSSFDEIGEN